MGEDPRSGGYANRSAAAIIAEARRAADDIRRRAERDASDIRRDAAEWAATTRREAEEYRDRLQSPAGPTDPRPESEPVDSRPPPDPVEPDPSVIDIRPDAGSPTPEPPAPGPPPPPPPPVEEAPAEEAPDDAERREFVATYLAEHRRHRRWRTICVALVGLAVLGAGGVFVALNLPEGDDDATPVADVTPTDLVDLPPDPQGRPLADVIADLNDAGLDFSFARVPDEDIPAGAVISMSAAPGSRVPQSTVVNLLVSKGPSARTIPDFERGADGDTVAAALEGVGLRVDRREVFDEDLPAGKVLTTSPAAGSSVPRGGTVTVTVSKGPDVVLVPDLAGRSLDEARALLRSAGLTTGELHGHDHGVVVDQRPDAGATARRGTPVNLRRVP